MIDRRRLGLRRPTPELLGLSTLDTVTCALAGAIVLMMFMAFLTKSSTQVVLTDMRELWQSGVAQAQDENPAQTEEDTKKAAAAAKVEVAASGAAIAVRNVAVLFIDLDRDVPLTTEVVQACDFGEPLHVLHSAKGHRSGLDKSHAVVIWAERPDPQCTDFRIKVTYDPKMPPETAPACEVTLVSGAHYDVRQYASCQDVFDLYTTGDQVFRLERLQP